MAATFSFEEDSGVATGTPVAGTTRTPSVTNVNWKSIGDATTAYTAAPIVAGTNSFTKYQSGKFTGAYNLLSAGTYQHTAGILGAGLTLNVLVSSTYAIPTATLLAGTTDHTTVNTAALAVNFNTFPQTATATSTYAGGGTGYTQFLITQLVSTSSAVAGDTATVSMTLKYDEN